MHTELGSSQVEVQRCALSWEVGEELGDELAKVGKVEVEVEEAEVRRTASRGGGGEGGDRGGGSGRHAL